MAKTSSTKQAFLMSLLSMLLCVSMLLGTTFAWFTDTVTSGVNRIVAGNLDIELEWTKTPNDDSTWKTVEGETLMFDDVKLWEPGAVSVTYLRIRNAGTLALRYVLAASYEDVVTGADDAALSDVLKTAILPLTPDASGDLTVYDRAAAMAEADKSGATSIKNYVSDEAVLKAGEDPAYLAMIIYFPSEVGNIYNGKLYNRSDVTLETTLGLILKATQATVEKDSFDEFYDKNAELPIVIPGFTVSATAKENQAVTLGNSALSVTIPATETTDDTYRLVVEESATPATITLKADEKVVSYDIKVVDSADNVVYTTNPMTVRVYVGPGLTSVTAYHEGAPIAGTYDRTTGYVTLTTTGFSVYSFVCLNDPDVVIGEAGKDVVLKAGNFEITIPAANVTEGAMYRMSVEEISRENAIAEMFGDANTFDTFCNSVAPLKVDFMAYQMTVLENGKPVSSNMLITPSITFDKVYTMVGITSLSVDGYEDSILCPSAKVVKFSTAEMEKLLKFTVTGLYLEAETQPLTAEELAASGLEGYEAGVIFKNPENAMFDYYHVGYAFYCDKKIPDGSRIEVDGSIVYDGNKGLGVGCKLDNTALPNIGTEDIQHNVNFGELVEYYSDCTMSIKHTGDVSGITLTIEIRLYEVDLYIGRNGPECETGKYLVAGAYTYTFD